jgi:methionine synthase II (cobalamin-independent)
MRNFQPRARATGIGSMPHSDPQPALSAILRHLPEIPFWPQLPRRNFRENMYVQFSEDMVGVKVDLAHEHIGVQRDAETLAQVEAFYACYLENDPNLFAVREEYAAGVYALSRERQALRSAEYIKGQITGPISFGLNVTDQNLRPILYDDTLRDVLVKLLARKAQWEEDWLASLGATIIFVDEPSLALIGASVVSLNRDEVIRDLEEVFAALHGLKGTHCCGNTDWSLLLNTSVDVISFDAFNYAENLALFADDVKRFLNRGGAIAWGIVPTVEDEILQATEETLLARLDAAVGLLLRKGIDRDLIYERALLSPACGLGTVSVSAAERALELAHAVSQRVRAREGWG